MKIAIQGFSGSFHALAAKQLYGEDIELVYCKSFAEVFKSLQDHVSDRAVVAIENSLYGSINAVYDLLHAHTFKIVAEAYELVGLHLLGVPGATLEGITDVYSQAPALGESTVFLEEKLPNAELHEHADTALAAKEVATWGDPTRAAIASKMAAKEYGLEVIARNIETHAENYTRFIALSLGSTNSGDPTKTSILFQTADTPGSLYQALGVFAKRDINLTKLESRPIIGDMWRYMYYVDFNLGMNSGRAQEALSELKNYATDIQVLGSYATDTLRIDT